VDFPQRNSDFGAPPTAAAAFPMAYILRTGGKATERLQRERFPEISGGHETNFLWEALPMAKKSDGAKKEYFFKVIKAPIGALKLVASDDGLAAILWEKEDSRRVRLNIVAEDNNHPMLLEAERQLGEYFSGRRKAFDLKLDFAGTEFQKKVWAALLAIPFGETRSYGEIARQLGNPRAMRAVGAANGKNPIAIVAPCHRVIGSRATSRDSPAVSRRRPICWAWNGRRPGRAGTRHRKTAGVIFEGP